MSFSVNRIKSYSRFVFFLVVCIALVVPAVSGADETIETYLGDTLTLHGTSYVGDQVYLFMTGPGLPVNGVTLTDVSQRADQGHFTIVDVDNDQQWSMRWDTSRIDSRIDPGTYIVYVTTEPVDYSHLGGTSSYKTLSVYLKDPGTSSKVSISGSGSYTLNPELHSSTASPTLILTPPPTIPTTVATETLMRTLTTPTPLPTTKARTGPLAPLIAIIFCSYLSIILVCRNRQ
jgi:hypothetical protein